MTELDVEITVSPVGRLAIPMDPALIRAFIPVGTVGTYLLLQGERPIYVGRSDRCLRTRLVSHELASEASHVTFSPCRTAHHAFSIEADWYHRLADVEGARNAIHPARPAGSRASCPFCVNDDRAAFDYALGRTV